MLALCLLSSVAIVGVIQRRHREPSKLTDREEAATSARVDWALHLHRELHSYVRTSVQMMQLLAAAAGAAATVIFRDRASQTPALLVAPFVLGVIVLLWIEYLREVMVNAGIVEHLEDRVQRTLLTSALVHERVLAKNRIGRPTALANNTLMLGFLALLQYLAWLRAFELPGHWTTLYRIGMGIFDLGIAAAMTDTALARGKARSLAAEMDP